jgi:helix-turn-helix, Psq domain
MVRSYKPKFKADNGMANAVNAVISGTSYRRAAAEFNVKAATLQYHVKKAQNPVARKKHETSRVFSEIQESALVEHLLAAAKMYHGLTYLKVRSLAYDYGFFFEAKDACQLDATKNRRNRLVAGIFETSSDIKSSKATKHESSPSHRIQSCKYFAFFR